MSDKGGEHYQETDKKYKMFRNYMTNELGITKRDIQAWTKEAVTDEVHKSLKSIDMNMAIQRSIDKHVEKMIGSNQNTYSSLKNEMAKELVKKINIEIKQR